MVLSENSIISEPVWNAITKMAKFRNSIVHDYARIEPEVMVGILQKNVEDMKIFSREIIQYLK